MANGILTPTHEDSGWIELSTGNFYRIVDDVVHLFISNYEITQSGWSVVATLPSNARPKWVMRFTVPRSDGSTAMIDINNVSGDVNVYSAHSGLQLYSVYLSFCRLQ